MKKLLFYFTIVMTLLGCNNKIGEIVESEEFVTVRLKATGELIETQRPLTKSSQQSGLYGMQITISNSEEKVAYGVFDNLDNMVIMLPKNKKFDIEMTYLPNGKEDIYYHENYDCYEFPLMTKGWGASPLNTLIYSKNEYLCGLSSGSNVKTANRANSIHLEVDRYYGYYSNYTPSENGVIYMDMKRMVFGLTFRAKRVEEKQYDKILIQIDADATLSNYPKNYYIYMNQNESVSELVIPFICLSSIGPGEREEYIMIGIGTDEKPGEIFYGEIKVKRNTMHIYEFDAIDNESVSNGLQSNIDSTPMENKNERFD